MSNYNLTNQTISSSFQQLLQKNEDSGTLVNGTGSLVDGLIISGTLSASFFVGDGSGLTGIVASASLPGGVVSSSVQVSDITGSSLVTASFNNGTRNLTFTKGDGSIFALNIPDVSGSAGNFVTTSSFQTYTASVNTRLNVIDATTASLLSSVSQINVFTQSADSRLDNLEAVTGSYVTTSSFQTYTGSINTRLNGIEAKTGSYATTGSNTFVGNQIINGNLNVTGQFTASGLWYPTVDGIGDMFLSTDGAGNLEFDWVKTLHQNIHNSETSSIVRGTPLFVSGATGDNANVYFADAGNPARRPATLIAFDQTLAPAATGQAIINGEIQGVDTSLYTAGTVVYLESGGGWTATRPTGSASVQVLGVITRSANNGRGIVFNQISNVLPNIQTGHVWVGNGNSIPTETPTASIQTDISGLVTTSSFQSYTGSTNARLNSIEVFTQSADSRLDNIESNTGSYARTDVNNNFTGTQNFVNISVSGTGSFGYLESITGSAKIIGDAFIILNNDTPTERYAGIIVVDSGSANTTASFQFDGLTNDWFYEYTGSDPTNFGVVMFGPEYATKGSPIYPTANRVVKGNGGHHIEDTNITDDGTVVSINSNTQITGSVSASLGFAGNLTGTASFATSASFAQNAADLRVDFNSYTSSTDNRLSNIESTTASLQSSVSQINGFTQSADTRLDNLEAVTGSYATTGSNNFIGNQTITGSLTISSSTNYDVTIVGKIAMYGPGIITDDPIIYMDSPDRYADIGIRTIELYKYNSESIYITSEQGGRLGIYDVNNSDEFGLLLKHEKGGTGWTGPSIYTSAGGYTPLIGFPDEANTSTIPITIFKNTRLSGSLDIQNTLTASLTDGYIWVGNGSDRTYEVATSSFATTGSNTFVGSQILSSSVRTEVALETISSNTASIDFSDTSLFVLNLVSGSTTRIEASNASAGQTLNILVRQPSTGTGSVVFGSGFFQISGSAYTASPITGSRDILTMITFDSGSEIYVVNAKRFI